MRSSEGRDVGEQVWLTVEAFAFSTGDGLTEVLGVPVDDDGGEQIETCHAEVLTFGGAVLSDNHHDRLRQPSWPVGLNGPERDIRRCRAQRGLAGVEIPRQGALATMERLPPPEPRRDKDATSVKLLGQRLMARDFERQVAEFQVRVAVLNGFTALGIPVTELAG